MDTESKATRYLALLRGINVGGRNVIRMADLRAALTERDFDNVATYIQSGNVLWTDHRPPAAAGERIEAAMAEILDNRVDAVVLTRAQLDAVVADAPPAFGVDRATYRYDVMFLMPGTDAAVVAAELPLRDGVDTATAGNGVVYFSRLSAAASRSYLSKIVGSPVYRRLTIRNWNTTTRLQAMLAA